MGRTNISWATHVLNITAGCTKVSAGCQNCWAERMAFRLKNMGRFEYQEVVSQNGWTGQIVCMAERLRQRFPKGSRVFVNSMSDLFHEGIGVPFLRRAFAEMSARSEVRWLLLTKRPQNIPAFVLDGPIEHIFLGVSVENQQATWRIEELLKRWRGHGWVSVEPMLTPVDLAPWLPKISWAVCGGESGPRRRPFNPEWALNLYEQCRAAGVPFFFKQGSGLRPGQDDELPGIGVVHEFPGELP